MTLNRSFVAIAALLLFLPGCRVAQSMVDTNGPAANTISELIWTIFLGFSAVAVIMWILIAWMALRRRNGTIEPHAPLDSAGGHYWIWIGGFAIPFVILAAVFIAGVQAMSRFPVHDGSVLPPADIQIVGHQWWWEVHYLNGPENQQFTTANEIHIPVGKTVDINLTSQDVIHSFWVPRLNGKFDLIPGQNNRIRIEASAPGEYRGQCAEFCGAQHAHMIILVVAQPEKEYNEWRMHQLQPAALPVTPQQTSGQALFLAKPCALCHEIAGTDAHGQVAPNLTHIASRHGIAANSLRNDTANLAAWVTHAQSLKPGAEMPNVTQFSGQELQDLVAYLQHLQ